MFVLMPVSCLPGWYIQLNTNPHSLGSSVYQSPKMQLLAKATFKKFDMSVVTVQVLWVALGSWGFSGKISTPTKPLCSPLEAPLRHGHWGFRQKFSRGSLSFEPKACFSQPAKIVCLGMLFTLPMLHSLADFKRWHKMTREGGRSHFLLERLYTPLLNNEWTLSRCR